MEKVPSVLYPSLQSPCILCDQGLPYRLHFNRLWALPAPNLHLCCAPGCILHLVQSQTLTHSFNSFTPSYPSPFISTWSILPNRSILYHVTTHTTDTMSSLRDTSASSIPALTGENYCLLTDDMKAWCSMVSGGLFLALRRSLLANPRFWTLKVLSLLLWVWEVKAERTCGVLKTAISHELRVLIRDCEDDSLDLGCRQGLLCPTEDCPSLQCLSHTPFHPAGHLRIGDSRDH